MKTKIIQYIVLAVAFICAAQVGQCQTPSSDLAVTAEAQLQMDTNGTRVFLTIHLINTTDHEVTVLTKNLNMEMEAASNQMVFTLGYSNPVITHDGHAIIPSLCDFSPVTLKPNEEACISKEMHNVKRAVPETQFVVRYAISSEWAKRFALWGGTVQSKPFSPLVRKPR
jgi:hypothetical protein